MNILVSASHLLITANGSSNFAIYCFKVKIKGVKANINILTLSKLSSISLEKEGLDLPDGSLLKVVTEVEQNLKAVKESYNKMEKETLRKTDCIFQEEQKKSCLL